MPRKLPACVSCLPGKSSRSPAGPHQTTQSLLVQMYAWRGLMVVSRIRSTAVAASSDCEAWPYLDADLAAGLATSPALSGLD